MSKILGIDFGERRVGIAIADRAIPIAFPRETIDCEKTDLWERLLQIIAQEQVSAIVLGMPYHPDGRTDGKNVVVEQFAQELGQRLNLPIHWQNEAYSSVQAKEKTGHFKTKHKKDKGRIDRAAATIILQNWLDENP
jgi:putative Holliday junction resolvase